jgi:hypothetical protein
LWQIAANHANGGGIAKNELQHIEYEFGWFIVMELQQIGRDFCSHATGHEKTRANNHQGDKARGNFRFLW